MTPILGYWKIRGLGQSIKLLLEYTGTQYEEHQYTEGPLPDAIDNSDWKPVKYTLGMAFPNLPYYFEGDQKITQSTAILYHLARKYHLCGQTEIEKTEVDMLVSQANDFRLKYALFVYSMSDTEVEKYKREIPETLMPFSDYLGDKKWFLGEEVTLPDFIIYELLDVHELLFPSCLASFKNLQEYHIRFQELPAIKRYMASPRFIRAPLNMKVAQLDIK